ncbi:MAG TPA: phosphoglycerate dehydrogenase [Planctomycetota bacterium]|nr:phosphoglycerate dehydrogenase [Planctomycetota bacterium]
MNGKKVLFIADKLSEDALKVLKDAPIEVDYRPGLPLDQKIAAAKMAHALIVRSETKVDGSFLAGIDRLELIVRAGVGVDNIDVDAATRKGIVVQNVPDGNVRSAAEHTIALILAMARNLPQANASMKDGKWERGKFLGVEVKGKTLGVIGLGKIGRHVVQMAKGLGFQTLAFDPFVSPQIAEALEVELVHGVPELAERVDFLTVHVPVSAGTKGLLGEEVFRRARPGIRVVNCARGGIVDEKALLAALESGKVAAAALDVFAEEPPGLTPLVAHPRVIVTPHLGASTREAQDNVAITAAEQVVDYLLHKRLHSPVNAIVPDPELREGMLPYRELALRLGRLQAQLLEGNPVRIVVKYFGDLFTEKVHGYISSSVLEGFLAGRSTQPVNVINSRTLARDQGLAVEERSEGKSRYFANLLRVEVTDGKGQRELGGAIRGRSGLRLVSLDGYHFDAVLEGHMLLVANSDRPGMIGVLGNGLASFNINISYMSLGRDQPSGTAVSIVNVDEPVPPPAVDHLRAQKGILWVKSVNVG